MSEAAATPPLEQPASRRALALGALVAGCLLLDLVLVATDTQPLLPGQLGVVSFLCLLAIALSIPRVQLPRGYLTLGAVATNAGCLVLTPRFAAVVGLAAGVSATVWHRRVVSVRLVQTLTVATAPICAAAVREHITWASGPWLGVAVALVLATIASLVLTGLVGSVLSHEAPDVVLKRNLSRHWAGAFIYFAIASVVIAHLLDQSVTGYALAALVAILSLALSDSVAGRQTRLRLQTQIDDTQRVVAYSRVIEGTIHNLRNHLAAAAGHLEEVATPAFSADDAKHVLVASTAVGDAVELLDQLQAGNLQAREKAILDLAELAGDSCLLLRGRAEKKRVQLAVSASERAVRTRSDPLLVKQILTNLVSNAIEAVGSGGSVSILVARSRTTVLATVRDNGPGVPDKYRTRLFEPHFTTKPSGNGIGLYVSRRLAEQLGGELRYEGTRDGGVFTLVLPRTD